LLRVECWKHGQRWAYSIIYGEGFVQVLENALPIHQRYSIPGCVAVVVGQLGDVRNVGGRDPYSGRFRHLSVEQLHVLRQHGWSVANHSLTHGNQWEDTYQEVVESNRILERLLGAPVTAFVVPNDSRHHGPVLPYVEEAGYLSVFAMEDRLNHNHVDEDLFALGRSPLFTLERPEVYQRTYDPWWRLRQARETQGWIVDYTHLVQDSPPAPDQDITPALLGQRLQKVQEVGAAWAATPDEVVDYILTRRAAHPRGLRAGPQEITFRIEAPRIPARVQNRELTFTLQVPRTWDRPTVVVDGRQEVPVTALAEGRARFTCAVADGQQVRASDAA